MDFAAARERMGASIIEERGSIALRFRRALEPAGAWALDRCAEELLLHLGAAFADGAPPHAPWRRCGGLLRIDARDQGLLCAEIAALFRALSAGLPALASSDEEERRARALLGQQLEACLRGAAAELRRALLDEEIEDAALRFGGLCAVCRRGEEEATPSGDSASCAA